MATRVSGVGIPGYIGYEFGRLAPRVAMSESRPMVAIAAEFEVWQRVRRPLVTTSPNGYPEDSPPS